jgi:hypothetical protein
VAKCTTKLSNRIELDGDWEVGLAEIIYPCSWYNMKQEIMTQSILVENIDSFQSVDYNLHAGHYQSPIQLAKKCNDKLQACRLSYDEYTKKSTTYVPTGVDLLISERLSEILGFGGKVHFIPVVQKDGLQNSFEGQNAVDLNRGFYSIYVYCDIVECVPVGDTSAPLMRAINVDGKYSDIIQRAFDMPMYLPVQKKQFDTIEVNIMTDTCQPVPFESGKSLVTLLFRRSSNPYFLPR